jgi:hypothetical protein
MKHFSPEILEKRQAAVNNRSFLFQKRGGANMTVKVNDPALFPLFSTIGNNVDSSFSSSDAKDVIQGNKNYFSVSAPRASNVLRYVRKSFIRSIVLDLQWKHKEKILSFLRMPLTLEEVAIGPRYIEAIRRVRANELFFKWKKSRSHQFSFLRQAIKIARQEWNKGKEITTLVPKGADMVTWESLSKLSEKTPNMVPSNVTIVHSRQNSSGKWEGCRRNTDKKVLRESVLPTGEKVSSYEYETAQVAELEEVAG